MKTTLKIKNFKSLEDVEMELKPTTVLLGPNGAGKSSILKAMTFVQKNILEKYDFRDGTTFFNLTDKIDLGSYVEVVTNNDLTRKISVELEHSSDIDEYWPNFTQSLDINKVKEIDEINDKNDSDQKDANIKIIDPKNMYEVLEAIFFSESYRRKFVKKYSPNFNFSFLVQFAYNKNREHFLFLELFDNDLGSSLSFGPDYTFTINHKPFILDERLSEIINNFTFDLPILSFKDPDRYEKIINLLWNFINFGLTSNETWNSFNKQKQNELFFKAMAQMLRLYYYFPEIIKHFFVVNHLPSIRPIPQRCYILKNGSISEPDYSSYVLHLPNKTTSSQVAEIMKRNLNDKEFFAIANSVNFDLIHISLIFEHLRELNLAKAVYIDKDDDIAKIMVELINGTIINLAEASSGLQQLLPIILESLPGMFIEGGETLFIEQPELHLHPRLQASITKICKADDNPRTRYPHFLIETHSEHIIRSYQILVANKELDKNRLGINYFDPKSGSTIIRLLELDDLGNFLDPWPNGFFEEASELAYKLLDAQIKRED